MSSSITQLTGLSNDVLAVTFSYLDYTSLNLLRENKETTTLVAREFFRQIDYHRNGLLIQRTIRATCFHSWKPGSENVEINITDLQAFFTQLDLQTIQPLLEQGMLSTTLLSQRDQAKIEWNLPHFLQIEADLSVRISQPFISCFQRIGKEVPVLDSFLKTLEPSTNIVAQAEQLRLWWGNHQGELENYWLTCSAEMRAEGFIYAMRYELKYTIKLLLKKMQTDSQFDPPKLIESAIVEANLQTTRDLIQLLNLDKKNCGRAAFWAALSGYNEAVELLLPFVNDDTPEKSQCVSVAYELGNDDTANFLMSRFSQKNRKWACALMYFREEIDFVQFAPNPWLSHLYAVIPHVPPSIDSILHIGGQEAVGLIFGQFMKGAVAKSGSRYEQVLQVTSQQMKDQEFLSAIESCITYFYSEKGARIEDVLSLLPHATQQARDTALTKMTRLANLFPRKDEGAAMQRIAKRKRELFWSIWQTGSAAHKALLKTEFPQLSQCEPSGCILS